MPKNSVSMDTLSPFLATGGKPLMILRCLGLAMFIFILYLFLLCGQYRLPQQEDFQQDAHAPYLFQSKMKLAVHCQKLTRLLSWWTLESCSVSFLLFSCLLTCVYKQIGNDCASRDRQSDVGSWFLRLNRIHISIDMFGNCI